MATRIPDKPAGSYGVDAIAVPVLLSLPALALLAMTVANIVQSAPAWVSLLSGAGALVLAGSAHVLEHHPGWEVPRLGGHPGLTVPPG